MNKIIREIINRVYKDIIRMLPGSGYVQKLENALKTTIVIAFILGLTTATSSIKFITSLRYISDLEGSTVQLDKFLDGQQNNLSELIKTNTNLNERNLVLINENNILKKDIKILFKRINEVESENKQCKKPDKK